MIRQSRTMSLIEAGTNIIVGFAVALMAQITVFPLFGFRPSLSDNLIIGGVFTLVSLARSYLLRRLFEALRVRKRPPPRHDPKPMILRIHEIDDERSELINTVALMTAQAPATPRLSRDPNNSNLAHGKTPSMHAGSSG